MGEEGFGKIATGRITGGGVLNSERSDGGETDLSEAELSRDGEAVEGVRST